MKTKKALLIVDVQNDFCPGGALAVPEGNKIVPALNRYIKFFSKNKLPIFASRDWHPKKTKHFRKFGGVWPGHCIQDTKGARFHPKLNLPKDTVIVSKGMDPNRDSYSAFQAVDSDGTVLPELLQVLDINELYVGGLATDYCVKYSSLDALKKGIKVKLLADAIKGVDIERGDSRRAIRKMTDRGAKKVTFRKIS